MTLKTRAKKTIKRLRTLITKNELNERQKFDSYVNNNMDGSVFNKETEYVKNITFAKTLTHETCLSLDRRTPGDGNENTASHRSLGTLGDGKETNKQKDSSFLNTGFISLPNENEVNLNKSAGNYDILFTEYVNSFKDESVSELEKNIEAMDIERILLNECVIYEDDDESAFGDDSDCESISEFEVNIPVSSELGPNEIQAMFIKRDLNARLINEDDSMESFMNTLVKAEEIDEGLVSDCSDISD